VPLAVDPGDDLKNVLQDLYLLEPCGEKNPAPLLQLDCSVRKAKEVRGGHLKLDLELPGGRNISAFAPGLGHRATELSGAVKVFGHLRPDTFRGGDAVELLVRRVDA
jgi:single-stranded DNA-specific DHH superfamily exonuclease